MADSMSSDDIFVLLLFAPVLLPVAAPVALGSWDEGREWMIEQGFIASAEDADWEVPGWEGAGVGSAHVVLLVCLVVLALVIGTAIARRQRNNKTDTEGWGD